MSSKVERLGERVDALDGEHGPLPGWMRGMECLFGKAVVYHLLRMAWLELKMQGEGATPEMINRLETEEHGAHPSMAKDPASYPVREAVMVREWFMQHGKVEDALRRLCGLEGEITVESLECRMHEVNDAIDKQNAELEARIAARTSGPLESQLAKTSGTSGGERLDFARL
jgi:hypothetical protein